MHHFVRSGALFGFPELVRELGENPSAMLQEVGLGTAILHDPDLYIPYIDLGELLEHAARQCNCPEFGLILGSRQGLEIVGALGSAAILQTDLQSALNLLQMNVTFHARGARIGMTLDGEFVDLQLDLEFIQDRRFSQLQALSMTLFCRSISQLHNDSLIPLEVDLNINEDELMPRYAQIMACPVQAGASINRARYPADILHRPVRISDSLRERLNRNWRKDLSRNQPARLKQQVERAITALLPTGECKLDKVSHIVGMHPRILQRQLKAEHSSFGQLLLEIRHRLAGYYLKNSDIDITTLAMNLGFGDVASFSRMFKASSGLSPRKWRNNSRSQTSD